MNEQAADMVESQPPKGPSLIEPLTLLQQSFRYYTSNFLRLTLIAVLPFVVIFLTSMVVGFITALLSGLGDGQSVPAGFAIAIAVVAVLGLAFSLASSLALVYAIKETAGMRASYRYAFKSFFSYLWLWVVTSAIILGGLLMGIVPGIIFMIWAVPAVFLFVDQGKRGLGAFLTGKEYVRGYWGAVFVRMLLLWIIAAAIGAFLGLILFSLGLSEEAIDTIVDLFSVSIFTPFVLVYTWFIYRSLLASKPGLAAQPVQDKGRGFFIFAMILGVALLVIPLILILTLKPTINNPPEETGEESFTFDDLQDFNPADLEAIQVE